MFREGPTPTNLAVEYSLTVHDDADADAETRGLTLRFAMLYRFSFLTAVTVYKKNEALCAVRCWASRASRPTHTPTACGPTHDLCYRVVGV